MNKNEMLEYEVKKDVPNYKLFNGLSFTEEQYGVIERALVGKFTGKQMDYLMHPELPAHQLDEVRLAIKGGVMDPEQLNMLLTPGLRSWQLDILREGFENGIDTKRTSEIAMIGADKKDIEWIDHNSLKWGELKQEMTILVRESHNHQIHSLYSLRAKLDQKVGESMAKAPSDCPTQSYKEAIGLTL